MEYERILDEVVRRSGLAGRAQADAVVRATLQTLARCVPGDPVAALAYGLPPALADFLAVDPSDLAKVDLCGFIHRINHLTALESPQSTYGARVVFELVHETVDSPTLALVRRALDHDLRVLFDAGGRGAMARKGPTSGLSGDRESRSTAGEDDARS